MRWSAWLLALSAAAAQAQLDPPRIPRDPDIHGDQIVFVTEGDIWLGDLKTQRAERMTVWPGEETRPRFSPDGKRIAFTGTYDGRSQVYVMPVTGGKPERVTWDPSGAETVDWMPDGQRVLFRSDRQSAMGTRLWVASLAGGQPEAMPMPMAAQGAISPNGNLIAYTRIPLEQHWWRRYRGGMANDIYLYNRAQNSFTNLTQHPINEQYPVFVGERLFYVSELNGSANLYEWNLGANRQRQVTKHENLDVQSPGADAKRVIYRLGMDLWVLDPEKNESQQVRLKLASDRIHARTHTAAAGMEAFAIGPTGSRTLIEARGQIFSAPAERGDIREVAAWTGHRNKLATWSPDGKTIALVSDRSDEENVWTVPAAGGRPSQLTSFAGRGLVSLKWAANSKALLVVDASSTLWWVDAETGQAESIAQNDFGGMEADISQDGRFIVYTKADAFNQSSLYLFDRNDRKNHRLTFAPTRDYSPAFDRTGRFLYFLSNREVRLSWDSFDFQLNSGPPERLMVMALVSDAVNPFAERVDEERPSGQEASPDLPNPNLRFDFAGAPERVFSVPGVSGGLSSPTGGTNRVWFLQNGDLRTYEFSQRRMVTLAENVSDYTVSANGQKIAARVGGQLRVGDSGSPLGEGAVDLGGLRVRVEPDAEWRQILRDGWRHLRDNFYDPNLHGANWPKVWEKISAMLPAVADRSDLNDLIGQMQAELNVSHMYNGGGYDRFDAPGAPGGMGFLGADLDWDGTGMRIQRLFRGDGFEERHRSPLAAVGIQAKEGDYILAINGTPMTRTSDPYQILEGQGGRLVRVRLNSKPTEEGAREVWIRAMTSEGMARYFDWTTRNRAQVDRASEGQFAYLHLPDMGEFGMSEFTKHFYANLHKSGMILDARFNGGGITSGMILERLRRVVFEYDQGRYGAPVPYHRMGFLPRVVILVNEMTASDGEYFSTGFRMMNLGKSVGKRTWGGYAAVGGMSTVDGGFISVPVQGSFKPNGEWLPDGDGFTPDVVVELDPRAFQQGRDTQLERAIEVLRAEVRRDPPKRTGRMKPPVKLP